MRIKQNLQEAYQEVERLVNEDCYCYEEAKREIFVAIDNSLVSVQEIEEKVKNIVTSKTGIA